MLFETYHLCLSLPYILGRFLSTIFVSNSWSQNSIHLNWKFWLVTRGWCLMYTSTYCFEKMFWTFFPFFITSCNMFITSFYLEHLYSGPWLFPYSGNFHVCGHSGPLFSHSVFAMDFFPGLSFGCFYCCLLYTSPSPRDLP